MSNTRQKPSDKVQNIAKAADLEYNEHSGAKKVLGPIVGKLRIIGAANVLTGLAAGKTIAFFNNSGSVNFVAIGPSTSPPIAPASPADGFPLKPNDYTILAMGSDTHFIANSANVFAYEVLDDTYWQ